MRNRAGQPDHTTACGEETSQFGVGRRSDCAAADCSRLRRSLWLFGTEFVLHSDIIPEHLCDGELIQRDQTPAHVHFAWCSPCGTKFTYEPDSNWVTVVLPGMRTSSFRLS
jgi:hypothetical protein